MPTDKDPRQVYIRLARLSYPHLLEKHKANEDAAPKYSAAFLLDPGTKEGKRAMKDIEKAMDAACQEKWKKPFSKMRFKDDRCHYGSGDDQFDNNGDVKAGYEGMMVVRASNHQRIDLRNKDKSPVEPDDSPFYGGCYVQAIVSFYGTTKGGAPGLFATCELVRFVKDGERFGRPPVDDSILDDLDDDDDEDEDDDDLLD